MTVVTCLGAFLPTLFLAGLLLSIASARDNHQIEAKRLMGTYPLQATLQVLVNAHFLLSILLVVVPRKKLLAWYALLKHNLKTVMYSGMDHTNGGTNFYSNFQQGK